MARDFFYTRNDYLTDSPENITFHQAHLLSDKQFNEWITKRITQEQEEAEKSSIVHEKV